MSLNRRESILVPKCTHFALIGVPGLVDAVQLIIVALQSGMRLGVLRMFKQKTHLLLIRMPDNKGVIGIVLALALFLSITIECSVRNRQHTLP